MFRSALISTILLTSGLLALGGCPQTGDPSASTIIIRVINDSDFDIEPRIETAAGTGSFFSIGDGTVFAGETVDFEIDCSAAQRVRAVDPFQIGSTEEFVLENLPTFFINVDYACGEIITFDFAGNEEQFDLVVRAGDTGGERQIDP